MWIPGQWNFMLKLSHNLATRLHTNFGSYRSEVGISLQFISWSNLPILNVALTSVLLSSPFVAFPFPIVILGFYISITMIIAAVATKHIGHIRDGIKIVSNQAGLPSQSMILFYCMAPYLGWVQWVDLQGVPYLHVTDRGQTYAPLTPPIILSLHMLPTHFPINWLNVMDVDIHMGSTFFEYLPPTDPGNANPQPVRFTRIRLITQIQTSVHASWFPVLEDICTK